MADKIICLVGASGSGKTTLAKELEKEGYNIIHSYTTRKPRESEEWGHTFVKEFEKKYQNKHKTDTKSYFLVDGKKILLEEVIAYEMYQGNHYWATEEQYKGLGTSIYVVTPNGAEQVQQNTEDAEVTIIFLTCDTNTLKQRMLRDEKRKGTLINDRIRKDKEIFKVCKTDYVVDSNRELAEVLRDIKNIIEEV